MSKSLKRCFYDKLTFINLYNAHQRASMGKRCKSDVIRFEMDLETNLVKILKDIKSFNYKFGKYIEFTVYEPKERVIKSLPYRDRIVHQWYVEEFIKPFFMKRFIKDTYACLTLRGTHKAVSAVYKSMKRKKKQNPNYYVLKCDIKKYFYNIDKNILLNILKDNISDNNVIKFSEIILGDMNEIGIPIGNYTSQFFANIYLNEFDHYVKEILHIKYYFRYMDDFILFLDSKSEAKIILEKIRVYLNSKLHLELNAKSTYYINTKGIDFCGYRIFDTHLLLRKRFKKKVNKSIKLWNLLYSENRLNKDKFIMSWNSYMAHASHCNSYKFISSRIEVINCLNDRV